MSPQQSRYLNGIRSPEDLVGVTSVKGKGRKQDQGGAVRP